MEYIKVSWIHEFDDEPILLYSELDDNRNELRKIEIYKDESFGLASLDFEFGGAGISLEHEQDIINATAEANSKTKQPNNSKRSIQAMTDFQLKKTVIMQLIKEYIACAKYMCKALKEAYDTKGEPLLRAWRINIIPKDGILEDGFSFNFHGGGCYFEFENGAIDIDFGPNDRCDGFDAYRLNQFLIASRMKQNIQLMTESEIQECLNELLIEKIIVQPGDFPNPDLYYLNG